MELKTSFARVPVSQSPRLVVYSLSLSLSVGHAHTNCRRLYCIQLTRESKRDPDGQINERGRLSPPLLLLLPSKRRRQTDRQREDR